MNLEVRQSKKIFIIAVISVIIFELIWLSLIIFATLWLTKIMDYGVNDTSLDLLVLCFAIALFLSFVSVLIYLTYVYKKQVDIYSDDKMYRKRGDKIIFEIPYGNIIDIKQGFDSVFFILKTSIKRLDGKEAPRNFYEHYAKKDIDKIIKLISNYNYNSSIFKNGGKN